MCLAIVEIKANFYHVRPSLLAHQNVSNWTSYPRNFIRETCENIAKNVNLFKTGKISGISHKTSGRFIVNDDINKHKISVCNWIGINYVQCDTAVLFGCYDF